MVERLVLPVRSELPPPIKRPPIKEVGPPELTLDLWHFSHHYFSISNRLFDIITIYFDYDQVAFK